MRVTLYVSCGPCRPPRRNGSLEYFEHQFSIPEFQTKLRTTDVRRDWRNRNRKIKRAFVDPHPEIDFDMVSELEGNETQSEDAVLTHDMKSVYRGMKRVRVRTNPVQYRISEKPTEVHTDNIDILRTLKRGDIVSFDGVQYLPGDYEIQWMAVHGLDLFLWEPASQGISSNPNTPADKRHYSFPRKDLFKQMMKGYNYEVVRYRRFRLESSAVQWREDRHRPGASLSRPSARLIYTGA